METDSLDLYNFYDWKRMFRQSVTIRSYYICWYTITMYLKLFISHRRFSILFPFHLPTPTFVEAYRWNQEVMVLCCRSWRADCNTYDGLNTPPCTVQNLIRCKPFFFFFPFFTRSSSLIFFLAVYMYFCLHFRTLYLFFFFTGVIYIFIFFVTENAVFACHSRLLLQLNGVL